MDASATVVTPQQLLSWHRAMITLRCFDEQAMKLQRSGRIGFCVTSFGEEAANVGTAAALEPDDWAVPSYRQHGVALVRGLSLEKLFANLFGSQDDLCRGRQMPSHYSDREHKFLSYSSVIGTQITHGVGVAMASKYRQEKAATLVYFGDGASSANDFHAALTMAGVYQAPVVFCCVNNQFAISVPVTQQTGAATIADKGAAYGMPGIRVDGNDIEAVYTATRHALQNARDGHGPTLLEVFTYRQGPHTSSDDPTRYRDDACHQEWLARDPITLSREKLIGLGVWDEAQEAALWEEVRQEVQQTSRKAAKVPPPSPDSFFEDVYADIPPALAAQRQWLLENEAHLTLTAHGEFPL